MDLKIFKQNNFIELLKFIEKSNYQNIGLQFDFKENGIIEE